MPRIPENVVRQIQDKAEITNILSQYLTLEKKGKEYVAVCPFHEDHDPSLHISPQKQIYKCFVCGAGGNVFTFLQKMEGLSFVQSVKKAADLVGIPLEIEDEPRRPQDPKKPLYDVASLFAQYCSYELKSVDGVQAREYLKKRQFSDELIDAFQIGFAPDSRLVREFFAGHKLDANTLLQTGLVREEGDGYDPLFFRRITIPIHDPFGNLVGFTARALPGQDSFAKYINSPNSALYEKGNLIFNYHRAARAAKKAGRVIITEGAMDVLGLEKAGIHEGIACLGTAVTDRQISLIADLHVPVIVFYDADKAGQKAAWKFSQRARAAGLPLSFVKNSAGKDPDEVFCSSGAQALQEMVKSTISLAEFAFGYLKTEFDLNNYEDRKRYARTMASLIQSSLEPFEQEVWLERLKSETGFAFHQSPAEKKEKPRYDARQFHALPPIEQGRRKAEKDLLYAMLHSEALAGEFQQSSVPLSFEDCRLLSRYLLQAYSKTSSIDPVELLDTIEEPEVQDLLTELTHYPDQREVLNSLYAQCAAKIQADMIDAQINRLMQSLPAALSGEEKNRILVQISDLVTRKHLLKHG